MHPLCKFTPALLALALTAAPVRALDVDRFVAGDAQAVFVINVRQILDSPLAQKHLMPQIKKAIENNKDLQQAQVLIGLDPLKDIEAVIVSAAGPSEDKVQIVIRGKFDPRKIHTALEAASKKDAKIKISKLGDRPLYEGESKGNPIFAAFADDETLVMAPSKERVAAAVGKDGKPGKQLQAVLAGVNTKLSVWGAGVVPPEIQKQLGQEEGPAALAAKINAASGSLNLSRDLGVSFKVHAADARTARDLGDFVDQAKGLLAVVAQTNQELEPVVTEMLKTLQVKRANTDVNISFKLGEDVIEKLAKSLPKHR